MNALIIICGLGIVSLLAEIANAKKWLTAIIMLGLIVSAGLISLDWNTAQRYYYDMVLFDNSAIAFTILISIIGVLWFWSSGYYFKEVSSQSDRSALVVFAIAGAVIMVSFHNMAMLFLGIEILSISSYVLAGSKRESRSSNEAAFKYFLMGSFATGFLLMGIALLYGATGSFDISKIGEKVSGNVAGLPDFFYAGVLFILIGLAFKMSAVPFHFWAPDVYEGSPTAITAFMSTVVKIAAVGAFYRLFSMCFSTIAAWHILLKVIVVLTLVIPNVTAVYQKSVKRMLAYSSVGHIGYILLAFMASPSGSLGTIFYYLAAYAIASITAFSILIFSERSGEGMMVESFDGLFKRNSLLAVAFTISLLSLAGIPPLAGFFGKYMVFSEALKNDLTGMVVLAVVTSLIGVFYYFRVIVAMYFGYASRPSFTIPFSLRILLYLLIALIMATGIFPDWLISLFNG